MIIGSLNKYFFYFFIFTLVFGVLLYDLTDFKGVYELSGLSLIIIYLIYVVCAKKQKFNFGLLITLLVFAFYLIYSFYVSCNTYTAILSDFFIQIMPYVAFFMISQISPTFSDHEKVILKRLCIILWLFFIPIGFYSLLNQSFLTTTMDGSTNYLTSIVCLSLVYLFCSDFSTKEKLFFFVMLSIALIVTYAQFNLFFFLICSIFLFFFQKDILKYKYRIGVALICIFVIILYISTDQIKYYLGYSGEEYDFLTRSNLYKTAIHIIKDFFPLGSGFASFATQASELHSSHISSEYGLNSSYGLTPQNWFSVSESYFPSLAQYGLLGVMLYFLFWSYVVTKSFIQLKRNGEIYSFVIVIILISFIFIENVSNSFFTNSKGFFIMIFLGLLLGRKKELVYEILVENPQLDEPVTNTDSIIEDDALFDYQTDVSSLNNDILVADAVRDDSFSIEINQVDLSEENLPSQTENMAGSNSTIGADIKQMDHIYSESILEDVDELRK